MSLSKPMRRPWDEKALVQAVEELKSGRISYCQSMVFPKVPSIIKLPERYVLDVNLGLRQY